MDLWKAKSSKPAPLVVFMHGGPLVGNIPPIPTVLLRGLLNSGLSVAFIRWRGDPFPAPMLDGARAIQFVRYKAAEWNVDTSRIGAAGFAGGALIALWVGFHVDLAEPTSDDPVLWQSTRLSVIATQNALTSYDPRWIKAHTGLDATQHAYFKPLYNLNDDEVTSSRAYALYDQASPMNFVTASAPPVLLLYPKGPVPGRPPDPMGGGVGMHRIEFGEALKRKMDSLKVETVVQLIPTTTEMEATGDGVQEMVGFLSRHLGGKVPVNH